MNAFKSVCFLFAVTQPTITVSVLSAITQIAGHLFVKLSYHCVSNVTCKMIELIQKKQQHQKIEEDEIVTSASSVAGIDSSKRSESNTDDIKPIQYVNEPYEPIRIKNINEQRDREFSNQLIQKARKLHIENGTIVEENEDEPDGFVTIRSNAVYL